MANHAPATARPSLVKRLMQTRKGRVLLVLSALMLAGTVAAAAAFFALAKVQGSGQSGTFSLAWQTGGAKDSATTISTAGAPTVTGGVLSLPSSGLTFFPGDKYVWTGYVKSTGTDGFISGVTMPGLPAGYTATLLSGCGAAVSTSTTTQVKIQIELSDAATPDGKAWTLGSAAGVQAAPASQGAAPSTCPAYAGTN